MRQHLRYFSNIFFMVVFTSSIALDVILMSGCGSLKKSDSENIESQKRAGDKTGEKTSTAPKDFTASEDKEKEDEHDYSTAAYYYYMKSERHKQKGEIPPAIEALQKAIAIDPESIYLNKNLVILQIMNKDNTSAMEVAAAMSQKHPDNEEILVILAKLKLQLNQVNEAKNLYKRIIKLNPENHDAYIMLGNIYMNNRQNEEAFSLFSAMVKQFPDSYGAHFFLGKLQAQKNNSVQAEKEFIKSIELRNGLLEPRFELISIYKNREAGKVRETSKSRKTEQKNYSQKVISLYEEIIKIENNNIKASIELPLYLYKKGEKAKASAMFIDFGQKYQNDDAMMVAMVKELINNDNKNDAVIVFNEILKANPNIHYIAGLTFDALKDNEKAISHFLKVSPDSEQYQKSVFHIAYIYNKLKQNNKAIEFLEKKLIELPKDTELIGYLATFYEEDGQLDNALELLQQGLKEAPDDTELLFRSGVVFDKSGDKDGSVAAMKRVIELDSEHASALNYLGYTYADLGINLDEAEELIKRSLALKPNDGYITDSLGWVYYKKGEYDKAIEILEKAVTLSSGDSVISEHLGDAYKEKKFYSKAIGAYKNALLKNKNPENKAALEKKIHEIETIMKHK